MSPSLQWKVTSGAEGTEITLSGPIDEQSDLDGLFDELPPRQTIRIDLSEVHRISSVGVRTWICFMDKLKQHEMPVVLIGCSVCIVRQMNMILQFRGHGVVRSVYAPYYCARCNKEELRLIDVSGDIRAQLRAPVACSTCGSELGLDEEEALYTELPS